MAWTVFDRSDTRIMGSNPTQVMDVCVCIYSVFVLSCVRSDLATAWSPIQGVPPTVYKIKKLKSGQGPKKGSRARDGWVDAWRDK
jgi:hypothetical protein